MPHDAVQQVIQDYLERLRTKERRTQPLPTATVRRPSSSALEDLLGRLAVPSPRPGAPVNRALFQAGFPLGVAQQVAEPKPKRSALELLGGAELAQAREPGDITRPLLKGLGAVLSPIQKATEAGLAGVQEQALAETGGQLAIAGFTSPRAKKVSEEVAARPRDWASIQQRYMDDPAAFRLVMETAVWAALPPTAALRAPLVALRSAKDTPTMVRIVAGAVEKGLLPFDLVEQAIGKAAGVGVQAIRKVSPVVGRAGREAALAPARLLTGAVGEGGGAARGATAVGREAEILAELKRIERSADLHSSQYARTVPPWRTEPSPDYGPPVKATSPAGRSWLRQQRNDVRANELIQELKAIRAAPKSAAAPVAAQPAPGATLPMAMGAGAAPPLAPRAAPIGFGAAPVGFGPQGPVVRPVVPIPPGVRNIRPTPLSDEELAVQLAQIKATEAAAGAPPPVKPPATAPPTGGPEEFAANIRLSKYPEDIRGPIKEWAAVHADEVQEARRGVRTDAQVLADARALVEEMGGDFAKAQRRWKPGEAWNAEEIIAIRGVLRERAGAVLQAAQVARADNSAANHVKLLLAMQEQARVQEIVHGVNAEAGRALRALRQQAFDAISADDNQKLEELLRRLGNRAKLDEVAAALVKLDINNPVAVNEFIHQWSKPGLWDYVMEVYINGLLSSPKTHIVNALSNTINALVSPVERAAAAGVEQILAPLQRRQVERFLAEVPADVFGAIEGISEGARAGLDTLKYGINPSQLSKWEFRRTAFRGNLGRVIRAPGTALEAADAVGYAVNYRAALNAGITRQARKEGLKGQLLLERIAELKLSPTEALIKQAQETAEYRLFRNESALANFLLEGRAKYPALRLVIPFIRTPVNLVKFGLERSPMGFVNPSLWRNLVAKNPAASDQLARAFLGSTLAALIAWKFAEGRITGAAPKGQAERDRFYREGKLPFAIRIGDTWIQYQRLEPFNQPLALVAAAIGALEAKDKTATEKVQQAIYTLGQNLVSQTFLFSLNSLLQAITEPERYGPTFLAREVVGLVPFSSALRTAAQATDPTFRKPRTLAEQVQAGLPGFSRNVPPILTAFGEEAQRRSPAISPIQITPAQQSVVDAELERVGVEVGFVGTTIMGVKLSPEQQQEYQRIAGQLTYQALSRLVESGAYQSLKEESKTTAIERIISLAREQARLQMLPLLVEGFRADNGATPAPATGGGSRYDKLQRALQEALAR